MNRTPSLHIARISAVVIFSVFQTNLSAQLSDFERLPSSNQLLANSVFALLRDREGFLWIGTQHGLHRYDGKRFTIYTRREDDSTSLSDNFILSLTEDATGNIWIGTRHGLNRFDKQRQTFQRYFLLDLAQNPFHQTITSIAADRSGMIYATIAGKMYIIHSNDHGQVRRYDDNESTVYASLDRDHHLVIARSKSLEVITPGGSRLKVSMDLPPVISTILKYRSNVYVASEFGVMVFSVDTLAGTIDFRKHILVPGHHVHNICLDEKERIWLATDDGLTVISPDGNRVHVRANANEPGALLSSNVRALISDASGLVWIGMLRHGVQKYDPLKENIHTVGPQTFGDNSVVWAMVQDRSKQLWVGTQNGLYRFPPNDTVYKAPVLFAPSLFASSMVGLLKEDRAGNIWIGTKKNMLWRYSPVTRMIERYDLMHYANGKKLVTISDLCERREGGFWVATTNGLFFLDPSTKQFQQMPVHYSNNSNENTYLMSVMEAADGTVWSCSSYRLHRYDPSTRVHTMYGHHPDDSTSISFPVVSSVFQDSKERLWVSTLGRGINRLDPVSGRSVQYHSGHGLVNDVVYGILEDAVGRLWMSTDNGIACFDPEREEFFSLGKEEGLKFMEFSQNAFFTNGEGSLFFGGIGGLVRLLPEKLKARDHTGPIIVTDIRINYSSIPPSHASLKKGTITSPQEIHLSDLETTLSIDFASLDFRAGERVKYAYRLSGFYDDWVEPVNSQQTAHYTHLPSGEYIFSVRSSIQTGSWSNDVLQIRIIVYPPFWETWWFMMIGISIFLGGIVAGVRFISQRKLKEQLREIEVQQKIHSERERISRELHDNTGAHLAGIISGLAVAEKHLSTSVRSSKKTIRSLTTDARDSMAQLRETIWAMKTNEMQLDRFSEAVEENIRRMLKYKTGIELHFQCSGREQIMLSPMQVLNLYRIVQESVSNALMHSNTTRIDISVQGTVENISIVIENNGTRKKIRTRALMHGHGTANMERRTKELRGSIQIAMGEKQGCRVTVTVPLHFSE
jgi:ligand-binding sensor domain-containing protein/signal transduction histidine kinase